ncbi:MAG: hypothetical protein GF405_04160 [Candidatus Eisenbacteria bacterium]|nr:hypothetical protein [Candidatus Eisenbacteria bacterium]
MRCCAGHRLIVLLAAVLVVAGCGGGEGDAERTETASLDSPILLLGIDGAEWSVLEPLLEAGELPNLSRLIENGASGELRSLEPRRRSPVIWATIATGKPPEEHGVAGFLSGSKGSRDISATPLSSNMWEAPAFWDVYGDAGFSVGVVGWLVTWPAWEVNGFMVSQHVQYLERFGTDDPERSVVYPHEHSGRIAPLVRTPPAITDEEMARFVNLDSELGMEALEGNNSQILRRALSGDETAVGVTLELLQDDSLPDLMCVYLRGVDEVCHGFWIYMDPGTRPERDPEDDRSLWLDRQAEALSGLIAEYYRYADEQVGRILSRFPDDTTVVVCSDHGFRGPGDFGEHRPWMGEDQHALDGVVILNGPGIEPGTRISNATVYDIAPTVLALGGLPVARDMQGRVLTEAFAASFVESNPVAYVESYEDVRTFGDASEPIESPVDDEVRERLRSLGYIE